MPATNYCFLFCPIDLLCWTSKCIQWISRAFTFGWHSNLSPTHVAKIDKCFTLNSSPNFPNRVQLSYAWNKYINTMTHQSCPLSNNMYLADQLTCHLPVYKISISLSIYECMQANKWHRYPFFSYETDTQTHIRSMALRTYVLNKYLLFQVNVFLHLVKWWILIYSSWIFV